MGTQGHFENTSNLNAGYLYRYELSDGNERMSHHLIEIKSISSQRAEFKDKKIKVKKLCSSIVYFAKMSLQQLKMLFSSLYAPHVCV